MIMKTKKKNSKFTIYSLTFIIFFSPCIFISLNGFSDHSTPYTPADEIEKILEIEQQTPLQTSVQSIKGIFATRTIPTLSTKAQTKDDASLHDIFNKSFFKYIKNIYNDTNYAEVLSQNGTHIVDFLELVSELNLNVETTYVCLRLFYNKLKEAELIDDAMLLHIFPHLTKHLARFFAADDHHTLHFDAHTIQERVTQALTSKLMGNLPEFQQNQYNIINPITQDILHIIKKEESNILDNVMKQEGTERLRNLIIRVLELILSKVVWNTQSPEGIWQSFLTITTHLQMLGDHNIINHMDDLDDMLWTATHRFCYFLDLTSQSLPISIYEEIEHDLQEELVFFLEVPEQDQEITTKKEKIKQALTKAKIKSYAFYEKGLLL